MTEEDRQHNAAGLVAIYLRLHASLQSAQNATSRIVYVARRRDYITPPLDSNTSASDLPDRRHCVAHHPAPLWLAFYLLTNLLT